MRRLLPACIVLLLTSTSAHAAPQSFPAGSLIIPMDLAYQDTGVLQAYGLLFQLLRQNVPVEWVIDPAKTWHAASCNTGGNLCAWDCKEEGSGVKCAYPTASPDFYAGATVLWNDGSTAGTTVTNHGYRGGPFVIDAAYHDAAVAIIDAWNDPALWAANPWAQRVTPQVVTVHEATAAFTADVSREMLSAPTIAVFADGTELVATGYLREAGIKQSSGAEFPNAKCDSIPCGPGTVNPDMLTVPSVAGDMGTCDAQNHDHKNGALFNADGLPQYCQIMSMHWDVNDRETVLCNGGACPALQGNCTGQTITYHGHEVVAEVRAFLEYPVHFFAECQAVNAYENTIPNPAWPYLDDDGRYGHYLTTEGTPPACPPACAGGFSCVNGFCESNNVKEKGAGFLIASTPSPFKVLHPEVPYNQMDGNYTPDGGSEPAYNLSTYLGTTYKNDQQVTFITDPTGPGVNDLWMSGYLDGECDITDPIGLVHGNGNGAIHAPGDCPGGKVSYLGGHDHRGNVPLSSNAKSQGARLFLNALFEADCVTAQGQPDFDLTLSPVQIETDTFPVEADLHAGYANLAPGGALDAELRAVMGAGIELVAVTDGNAAGDTASWTVGSIGGSPTHAGDPSAASGRTATVSFADYGTYDVTVELDYRVGVTTATVTRSFQVMVVMPGTSGDDAGIGDDDDGGSPDGGCCDAGGSPAGPSVLLLALLALRRRRS